MEATFEDPAAPVGNLSQRRVCREVRLRQLIRFSRGELRAVREASERMGGGRNALVSRVRQNLHLEDVDQERIAAIESRLEEISARSSSLETRLESLARTASTTAEMVEGYRSMAEASLDEERAYRRHTEFMGQIPAFTTWLAATPLGCEMKVSVVMATRNRVDFLERAIKSVQGQVYPHWELVVVDDGSTDDTPQLLERLCREDERIVCISGSHAGAASARNQGLRRASGEIVCYQDDDNLMQPLWLKAVAWSFDRDPETKVVYGAAVVDVDHPGEKLERRIPRYLFAQFDRNALEVNNYIDLGAMAHRRSSEQAYFDETLGALMDWDLILRLTVSEPAVPIPVVALAYTVNAPGRITVQGHQRSAYPAVRSKVNRSKPLRVLAFNALYPLVTETYIGSEMKALVEGGATLAWCTENPMVSPVSVDEPRFDDLDKAVASVTPDLLFLHWTTFGMSQLDRLVGVGLPFAVRVHSFDFSVEAMTTLRDHPLCIGVWAYPHHARRVEGTHALVNLVDPFPASPVPAEDRRIVLSACAGLPKKDWPVLLDAFGQLANKGIDCRLVVGITHDFEDEPARVRELITRSGVDVKLSVDVPHDQVLDVMARAALVVYTLAPGGTFGMPSSVIEGMLSGASVVLPDVPESRLVAGPNCRTYRGPSDIARHALEVLAGGSDVAEEREFNRWWAMTRFANPILRARFGDEVREALSTWRRTRS